MKKGWVNLPELRKRVAHMTQLACIEEGMSEDVVVEVRVMPAEPNKKRRIVVEVYEGPHDDPTKPETAKLIEETRGFPWQDN